MFGSMSPQRDRNYIIEDIILKLVEYGELNQTGLISFCGLNIKKHRYILDELEVNGLIHKSQLPTRKRVIAIYKPTQKGIEFCRSILEPYERMFPRRKESVVIVNNNTNNDYNVTTATKASGSQEEIERQQQKLQATVS
jgi:predicted transcriptional regulator